MHVRTHRFCIGNNQNDLLFSRYTPDCALQFCCMAVFLGPLIAPVMNCSYCNLNHFLLESGEGSIISNSLRPHGLRPTRLLCPRGSPGKYTGRGCHAFLQGGLPDPGIEPASPALQADCLPTEPPEKPHKEEIPNSKAELHSVKEAT